jgi:hypothetical protein
METHLGPIRSGLIVASATLSLLVIGCANEDRTRDADLEYSLTEVSRVGSVEGETALADPWSLTVSGEEVFLVESQPPSVIPFAADGTREAVIGRPGEGPGEYRSPTRVGVQDTLIWVADPGAREIEFFSRDGRPLGSRRVAIEPDSGGVLATAQAYLWNGRIIAGSVPTAFPGKGSGTDHENYYLVDDSGAVLSTLYEPPLPETDFAWITMPGGGEAFGAHPLPERPLVRFWSDGIGMVAVERGPPARVDSARYTVRIWNPDGTESEFEVPYAPIAARGWKDREIAKLLRHPDAAAMPEPLRRQFMEAIRKGWSEREWLPPVTDAVAGKGGILLVRREDTGEPTVRWDILRIDGARLGTFRADAGVTLMDETEDGVWGIAKDEMDVPYLVRYRLSESSTPSTPPHPDRP